MKLVNMRSLYINVLFLFFILLLFNNIHTSTSLVHGNETDYLALMSFKSKVTSDPLQSLASWNESTHFCQWFGVTCGRKHQRVIEIDLTSKQLTGSLSSSVGNLSFVRIFLAGNNSFTGDIPREISRLSKLRFLNLVNNSFSGKIPSDISSCLNLESLDLGGNHLVGTIPNEFQSLLKLIHFSVAFNNLTGKIPDFLGNLSSLERILFTSNKFDGSIPDSLGGLASLRIMNFGVNILSGVIPHSVFNLSNLVGISLVLNEIEGSLPWDFGLKLPRLQRLNIPSNKFTGLIPQSLTNASQLDFLDIATNKFTGPVPDLSGLQKLERFIIAENLLGNGDVGDLNFISSLRNSTRLRRLGFDVNNLGGIFPKSVGNLSDLIFLSTFNNPIYGNIPNEIGELVKLEILGMGGSELSGRIPSSIGKLRELKQLSFNQNNLSGEIPVSLGNLTKLIYLYLGENNLGGRIPLSFANLTHLSGLRLSQNKLSGSIPSEIFSLPSLTSEIDLSNNRFMGPLVLVGPISQNLLEFRVSNNLLSGEIPSSFDGYEGLNILHLDGNLFQGSIPPSLSSLRAIEVIDLSRNNFSGCIPEYLGNFLFLTSLNLSFNDFEGAVPVGGVFNNGSSVFIQGNNKLCGGVQDLNLPKCIVKEGESKKPRISRYLIYVIPTCIGAAALIILAISIYKKRKAKKLPVVDGLVGGKFPQVSFRDLHKATDGFSSTNLCGSGKFSSVYKGVLSLNDSVVAVKVLKLEVVGAAKSFTSECDALRRIRHRNLLKILTSCSTIDFQGNAFKALVYPFMVNGSLEGWLNHDSRSLTLLDRLSIVIDVASALDYLHNHFGIPVVHCDVKPSNVLLDTDFVAHLGDFGLLKFIQLDNDSVSTGQASSLGLRGTVGYAAPEYGMCSEISTYGDVYSFGILILEIFSGKRPTDDMFSDGLNLHNYVQMAIPDRVMEISDSPLIQNREATFQNPQTEIIALDEKVTECLISIFRVGVACSVELPRDRVTISDTIIQLHLIKKTLLENTDRI